MRLFILVLTSLWLALATPTAAQEPANDARRLALAERYLELTQGENLRKTVTRYFEEAFSKADMPADQRDWLTHNMGVAFEEAMQATFADLRDDVAGLFTEEELEAMIGFSDTALGRSITEKSFEFGVLLQTTMEPRILEAFTQLGEKFCARFECPAEDEVPARYGA